jgi:hypothetical protein
MPRGSPTSSEACRDPCPNPSQGRRLAGSRKRAGIGRPNCWACTHPIICCKSPIGIADNIFLYRKEPIIGPFGRTVTKILGFCARSWAPFTFLLIAETIDKAGTLEYAAVPPHGGSEYF